MHFNKLYISPFDSHTVIRERKGRILLYINNYLLVIGRFRVGDGNSYRAGLLWRDSTDVRGILKINNVIHIKRPRKVVFIGRIAVYERCRDCLRRIGGFHSNNAVRHAYGTITFFHRITNDKNLRSIGGLRVRHRNICSSGF